MTGRVGLATIDTNVAVYALLRQAKAETATAALGASGFLSVQVLNEYANVASRKLRRNWLEIDGDLAALRDAVPMILPIDDRTNAEGSRIAERYRLSFYDALMLATALIGGARTFYSEDLQDNLVIDGVLRVIDPFRSGAMLQ